MTMKKEKAIAKLIRAQEKILKAIELVESVFPNDGNVETYFINKLKIMSCNDHGFLSRDLNIDTLIERIEND